jgi:hypothetical protein
MNSETGCTVGPNGKLQTSRIRSAIKKSFPYAEITFNTGHYYCSAFVKFSPDNIVYMMTSDYRYFPQQFLVRTAKHEKDYTGGINHNGHGFDTIISLIQKIYIENKR